MCRLNEAVAAVFRRRATAFPAGMLASEDEQLDHGWRLMCAGTAVDAECLMNMAGLIGVKQTERAYQALRSEGHDEDVCVANTAAGAWAEGVLVGLALAGLRELTPEQKVKRVLASMFPGTRITVAPMTLDELVEWATRARPPAPPLWTERCEGVQELYRDRRRQRRARPYCRVMCSPAPVRSA